MSRWSWSSSLQAALLPALFAGSELAWAYLGLGWLSRLPFNDFGRTALSWPGSAVMLGASIAVTRALMRREGHDRNTALAVLGSGLLVVVIVTWLEQGRRLPGPDDLLHLPDRAAEAGAINRALLFGAYLWWRGIAIARSPLHFDDANFLLIAGIAGLTVTLSLSAASGSTLGHSATALLVLQFFACTLPALAITRLEDIRRERLADSAGLGLSREWLGVLGLTVVGILLAALLIASTASVDLSRGLTAVLNVAGTVLFVAMYAVLLPAGFLVAALVYIARAVIALLGGGSPQQFASPPGLEDVRQQAERGASSGPPGLLVVSLKWLLLALVVALVATIIVRAVFRYRRGRGVDVEEIHESLWPGSSVLVAALWHWLLGVLGRLRRRRPALAPAVVLQAESVTDPGARSVRELYREWLAAAAARGRARRPDETPEEFLEPGRVLVPEAGPELVRLTRAYETARYAAPPLPEHLTDGARAAWERIRARLPARSAGRTR